MYYQSCHLNLDNICVSVQSGGLFSFGAAVLLMDDDVLVSAQDVQFAFRVWKVGTHTLAAYLGE